MNGGQKSLWQIYLCQEKDIDVLDWATGPCEPQIYLSAFLQTVSDCSLLYAMDIQRALTYLPLYACTGSFGSYYRTTAVRHQ